MISIKLMALALISLGLIVPVWVYGNGQFPPVSQWQGLSKKNLGGNQEEITSLQPEGVFPPLNPSNTPVVSGYNPEGLFPPMGYPSNPAWSNHSGVPIWPQYMPTPKPGLPSTPSFSGADYLMPDYRFSDLMPFGNSFSPDSLFRSDYFPNPWSDSSLWNPWKNDSYSSWPFLPGSSASWEKKAWGEQRNTWPDFYTGYTTEAWDKSINAPYDVGRMPGGWRAPSFLSADPATVGDAVINQFPPIMEEKGYMMEFSN